MQPWKVVLSISCCLLLAACGEESAIQQAVKTGLKDPESAQFGPYITVTSSKGATYTCITVNAKNSMGGYVGNQQALLKKTNGNWDVFMINEMSQGTCKIMASAG